MHGQGALDACQMEQPWWCTTLVAECLNVSMSRPHAPHLPPMARALQHRHMLCHHAPTKTTSQHTGGSVIDRLRVSTASCTSYTARRCASSGHHRAAHSDGLQRIDTY